MKLMKSQKIFNNRTIPFLFANNQLKLRLLADSEPRFKLREISALQPLNTGEKISNIFEAHFGHKSKFHHPQHLTRRVLCNLLGHIRYFPTI